MKKRGIFLVASILVVAGLLLAAFGCAAPTPTPTPTPTPSPSPTPKPSPTPTPTPTPTPSPSPTQPQVIKWNMQTAYPPTSAYTIHFAADWVKWVKEITGGRLEIQLHPAGTFAKAGEMLDAVSKGTFNVSLDFAGYYPEKVPISEVETGLPMAWREAFEALDAFYNRGLFDLVREDYAALNVYPLGIAYDGSTWYHFGTKYPFKSLDDVKGKKFRATGIYGKYTQALGGLPTTVAPTEMYMALKTGIIDGMIMGVSTLDTYKLAEVLTHYVIDPTLTPLTTNCPTVNLDSWKKLPDDLKKLLEQTRYFNAEASFRYKIASFNTVTWAAKTYGVKWVTLSDEDKKKALTVSMALWDDVAKKTPRTAKAVEIIKQQMRDYGRL